MICLPKLEKESKPFVIGADVRMHGLVRASKENLNARAWQAWCRMFFIRQEYVSGYAREAIRDGN